MQAGNAKLLVLHMKTPFCSHAAQRIRSEFAGKARCEGFCGYDEGRARAAALQEGAPAILVWSDGGSHHMSNVLNLPGSVKYVFDNHDDNLFGGERPSYDTHNAFTQKEGVLVRICRRIGRMPFFSLYDEGEGNGLLHLSMDLDFIAGFPALPWMSIGTGSVDKLREGAAGIASRFRLVRLDIGGFHEMGSPNGAEMDAVYEKYYAPLVVPLVAYLENGMSLPKSGDASLASSTRHFSSLGW